MPLQNRVTPFGDIVAHEARGLFMGDRGGRIHDAAGRTLTRRWASRRWICCLTAFNDRRRTVWGDSYTELFFLDEPTALAAGHRPCFECRRAAARAFFAALDQPMGANGLDRILHAERLGRGGTKRMTEMARTALPDGAMIAEDGAAYAVRAGHLLPWSPTGYGRPMPLSAPLSGPPSGNGTAMVLTPPTIVAILARGYRPVWHASADRLMGDGE